MSVDEFDLQMHHVWVMKALQIIDKLFSENDIPYFLIEGSALGAVRHKGIIPWDDDVDIGVFLKDRDRVSFLLEDNLPDEFQWIDKRTDDKYPRFFGKVVHNGRGCIDIFPLIKTGEDWSDIKKQWRKRKVLFKLYKAKLNYASYMETRNTKERIKVAVAKFLSAFVSRDYILRKSLENEQLYEDNDNNTYFINLYGAYSAEKELIKTEWISNGKKLAFGDGEYPAFENTHDYLTNLYGDYMTPPPVDKRIPHHEEIYNTNN